MLAREEEVDVEVGGVYTAVISCFACYWTDVCLDQRLFINQQANLKKKKKTAVSFCCL